ncbi:MAG TPA: ATP-binding protein [Polyangiaceae bacterium]|nr:ATP-binding protein [Polyangiaceae bacterium]
MSPPVDLHDFLAGFLAEADEHLRSARANLLALEGAAERGEASPRPTRELFRSLHTIKGLAAMVGVEPVVDIAHGLEAVLRAADRAGGRVGAEAIGPLVEGVRAIERRVQALGAGEAVTPAPARLFEALARLEPAAPAEGGGAPALPEELAARLSAGEREQLLAGVSGGRRALRVHFTPSPARAAEGVTITSVRERASALGELVKVYPVSVPKGEAAPGGLKFALVLLTDAPDDEVARAASADGPPELLLAGGRPAPGPALEGEDDESPVAGAGRSVVRVDVRRLDEAMEKLSALIVSRFRMGRAVAALEARGADVRELKHLAEEDRRQLRDLRASILRLRMVSVAELLEPVGLLVRGLGRATGKAVRLELEGGRAELDKAVAERVWPALVHLVRNAVDHGLEAPDERRRAGKPAEGVVRVGCEGRSNGRLEISVEDDGRGVDRAAVAARAGAPVPEGDAALLDLLARPGLSTRERATHTSGRGLGMDIVKRVVEAELGGELLLHTAPGRGTRFTLRVPQTVTLVDALGFACAGQTFLTPVSAVDEIVEVEPSEAASAPSPRPRAGAPRVLFRRGEALPLVDLGRLFGLGGAGSSKALVVRRAGRPYAFGVGGLLGQYEVIVRPLEDPLVRVAGVAGSADLGEGRPTLVLDLVALSATLSGGGAAA